VREGLELELVRRGCAPGGGGEVRLACPAVRELKAINFVEEGYVKRVRGVAYACRVSPLVVNRVVDGARCVGSKRVCVCVCAVPFVRGIGSEDNSFF
jgi:RNA 3'-terminal phosphate cyclase-like protein